MKTALFIEGEGDWIIAYQSRVFRFNNDPEDPANLKTVRRAARFLGMRPAPTDIWDFISDIRDKRSDVLVARDDGNRLLVESAGDYAHRTGSRLLQNVMKELGYEQVVYSGLEGEEYASAWDFQVKGELPQFLYHGTTSEHADKILRFGLQAGEAETNYPATSGHPGIWHSKTVFLTEDISKASYHAENAVNRDMQGGYSGFYSYTKGRPRGFPVIFEFEIPDPDLLIPDYDIENMSTQPTGTYEGMYKPKQRRGDPKIKESPFDMSKKVGIFGYRGRIPANFIRRILIKTETDDSGVFSQDRWSEVTSAQLQRAIEGGDVSIAFYEPEEDEKVCPECGWVLNDSGNCNCPDNLPLHERQTIREQSCRRNWLQKISNWYHGTDSAFDPSDFHSQSESINSTTFGPISVTRNGIFLTDNPELAKDYGANVMNLKVDVKNTANLTRDLRLDFVDSLDPWKERDLWILAKNALHDWQLFDNEVGARFVQWLKNQGYDSAILTEENDSGVSGKVLVVFDANNIKKASSFLHKKIARPQYGFLGKEFSAFRAVDLKRALGVLTNGFAADEFFATDINRAVFYGHFTQEKYPNIIFQCRLDSSRTAIDANDADSSEGVGTSYDNIQQAAFEIYRLVKDYDVQESDIEKFIGNQMGMGYDNIDAPSLWVYLNQLTNVPINEIKKSIPSGYYGSLVLDNRGVFGVTDEIPEMQLQYSAPVPPENIEKAYIHSSILDAFRYNYPRYPNGNPKGLPDEVSVIPAQVREFTQKIEEQIELTTDEDLKEELESLLSRLGESVGRYEDETNSAMMDGTIYRKLYQGLPLRLDDFQTTGGFVEFTMPQQRMQIMLIIKKVISRPDPRQMYLFPMSKYRGWLCKLASDYLYSEPGHDYEITWDHEVDEQVDPQIRKIVDSIVSKIQTQLIPKLKIFKSFRIEPVTSLNPGTLATYISGTYTAPVIAIDLGNIQIACDEDNYNCGTAIETTILHELGHAIQEAKDKSFDEDEAEEFALHWYYYRHIHPI